MEAANLVKIFDVGNSVAEFDADLEYYFVETDTFTSVIDDKVDVIAGDKGTGKTAIYRVLKKSYRSYNKLSAVEIVDAFNVQGNPIFQKLLYGPAFSEGQFRTFWKGYIFSLVGNYLIDIYGAAYNSEMTVLKNTLDYLGLSSVDTTPATIFGNLYSLTRRLMQPTAIEAGFTISETGLPVVTPRIEFGPELEEGTQIFSDDFLSTLNSAARTTGLSYWILFDRLDEAFSENQDIEIPALRALFRSYLDLNEFESIRVKLFVRRDLFRRIIAGGFVNLTHINARKVEIRWDEDDLINMIAQRLMRNKDLVAACQLDGKSNEDVLSAMLPDQVDVGDRKPNTKTWIMGRIRDGNDVRPPRNLIDLLIKAREAQLRKDGREIRNIDPTVGPLIEAVSMKKAVSQLSEQRVQDTLLAEAYSYAPFIEKFRDGKAEHNLESLAELLGAPPNMKELIQALTDMGFLEQVGENYKVPMLYRDGLKITQGKAFS